MWTAASPSTYSRQSIPEDCIDPNYATSIGSPCNPASQFSTFGKKAGRRMKQLMLEDAENMPMPPPEAYTENDGLSEWPEPVHMLPTYTMQRNTAGKVCLSLSGLFY